MPSQHHISRRHFLRATLAGTGAITLAACGAAPVTEVTSPVPQASAPALSTAPVPTAVTATNATVAPQTTVSAANFVAGLTPGSPTHAKGWTTTFPPLPEGTPFSPPVTITSSRGSGKIKFVQGDDVDNNAFTRMIKEKLGVEWKAGFTWSDQDEVQQKYNLAIASGELPDLLEMVPLPLFASMLEADLLEDITDVWERVADVEAVKKPLEYGDGLAWSYAQVNGRKMGIPVVNYSSQNDHLLWIRQDWLDKVGMATPTTLDELGKVALAFKNNNLGQGATGSTIGLNACNELQIWYASLDPIFGAFGVVPGYWTQTGNELGYNSIRSETKEALGLLRQWYADGVIPPDFFTRGPTDAEALVAGNQNGLHFSPSFAAHYGVLDSLKNDPNAKWTFTGIPAGPTGIKGKAWSNPFAPYVFAFRKGTPHVEPVIKQTNWLAQLIQEPKYQFRGWEGYSYEWDGDTVKPINEGDWHKWFFGSIGNGANSGTDPLRLAKYFQQVESWSKLPQDQLDAWQTFQLADPTGTAALERKAYLFAVENSEKEGIKDLFTTLPTATMRDKGADLKTLEQETFFGIIKGDQPLDAFDTFVSNWKSGGGDQITQEANEWWSKK